MPRHLTLTELVLNLVVAGAAGWWFGGWRGLVIGAGIVMALLARAIWIAANDGAAEGDGPAAAEGSPSGRGGEGPAAAPESGRNGRDG